VGTMASLGGVEPTRKLCSTRCLAWTMARMKKTFVRAGYGVYYDQSPLAAGEALYFNSPYFDNNISFRCRGCRLL